MQYIVLENDTLYFFMNDKKYIVHNCQQDSQIFRCGHSFAINSGNCPDCNKKLKLIKLTIDIDKVNSLVDAKMNEIKKETQDKLIRRIIAIVISIVLLVSLLVATIITSNRIVYFDSAINTLASVSFIAGIIGLNIICTLFTAKNVYKCLSGLKNDFTIQTDEFEIKHFQNANYTEIIPKTICTISLVNSAVST